jgi:hypothetical protein
MSAPQRYELVLAIYLTRRGFAFVLFEGALSPLDWGTTRRYGPEKNAHCLKIAGALFSRYSPDVLVLQDTSWTGTRRSQRVMNLNAALFEFAERQGLPICAFSRDSVRAKFNYLGSPTKHRWARHRDSSRLSRAVRPPSQASTEGQDNEDARVAARSACRRIALPR